MLDSSLTKLNQPLAGFLANAPSLADTLAWLESSVRNSNGATPTDLGQLMDQAQVAIFGDLRSRIDSVAAQALTLKVLNLWLARHHLAARSVHLGSRPISLYIDPSNSCNLACPGCVHSTSAKEKGLFDWRGGLLSPDRLELLLASYGPFAANLGFYNYGEPMVNPLTPKYIKLAKTYLLTTSISSNMALAKIDAEAYVDSGLDLLTMSIDGATQPVYETYRRKGDIGQVFANIAKFVEAKKKRNKQTPVLSWNFLAFEHNAHEIDTARQLAHDMGVDQFSVFVPFDVSWDDPTIRVAKVAPSFHSFRSEANNAVEANFNPFPDRLAAENIARQFSVSWVNRLGADAGLSPKEPRHACHWLYRTMVMDAGGRILPCCASPTPQRDLVFSQQDDRPDAVDHYNSPKYASSRSFFTDSEYFKMAGTDIQPHCVSCEWNQEQTNFDSSHVRTYLKGAETYVAAAGSKPTNSPVFDAASLELLCEW